MFSGDAVITGPKMAAATQELKMHSDVQDYSSPPDLTTLHGIHIPPPEAGGRTHFWDLFAAYDALDEATRARLAGLRDRLMHGLLGAIPDCRLSGSATSRLPQHRPP